jgi:hypothetical protein
MCSFGYANITKVRFSPLDELLDSRNKSPDCKDLIAHKLERTRHTAVIQPEAAVLRPEVS